MWEKIILKQHCSEWVIRNSLYWMTPLSSWKLEENLSSWIIFFEISSPECEFEFERLINDFSLREKLHHQTGQLRDAIVSKVLRSIDDRLA
ncbi:MULTISPECIES: His-Xaa-Ser system protein HxsD [Cedecea]|nr:His-Xaa-Ser system protein HxsD [Cedecea lapagei]